MKYEIKADKTHEPKSVNAYIIIKPRKIDYWKAQLITIALSTSNLIGYKTRVGKSCLGIIGGDVWNNLKTHVSSGLPDTSWEAQTKIFQLSFLLFINVIMQTLKFREAFHYNQASSTETLDLIIFRHKNHVSTTQWVPGVRPRKQTGHSSAWPQAWRDLLSVHQAAAVGHWPKLTRPFLFEGSKLSSESMPLLLKQAKLN